MHESKKRWTDKYMSSNIIKGEDDCVLSVLASMAANFLGSGINLYSQAIGSLTS